MTKAERLNKKRDIRKRFANLTEKEKQALQERAIIATVDGRSLSLANTMMVYLQSNGTAPSVVGGYNQWKQAGRQVIKGQHGYLIWIPIGTKNKEGNIEEVDNYFLGTVFDISQTEERKQP